jgi:hypothetical protein
MSLAHYIETWKQKAPDRRARLATFMLELSAGIRVALPHVVLRHDIEVALQRCFPDRIVPGPFEFLGSGLTHAADKDSGFQLDWPSEAGDIPAAQRAVVEQQILSMMAKSLLSGVLPTGDPPLTAVTDLSPEHRFKDSAISVERRNFQWSPQDRSSGDAKLLQRRDRIFAADVWGDR